MATKSGSSSKNGKARKIRYAVVGQGYISQIAVLPAFKHAKRNSELTALVSDDPAKLKKLGKDYDVDQLYTYDQYEECLQNVDAVYIALPNSMHREYTIRAANAGVHVLCEKPMAVTSEECRAMIAAAEQNRIKLMIAYRLHFEQSNLEAAEVLKSGKIGEVRFFNSVFSQQVKEGDIRLKKELGGGTAYDIGVYCINAARYLFKDEPTEVFASMITNTEKRFREVEEMMSVVMRFPKERLAAFTLSFGASGVSKFDVVGTKGSLTLDPAFEMVSENTRTLKIGEKSKEKTYKAHDQFGPELLYFSDCVLNNKKPEPSGREGLIDVQIVEAIYESARSSKPVKLELEKKQSRPTPEQEISKPKIKEPELYHAEKPSAD